MSRRSAVRPNGILQRRDVGIVRRRSSGVEPTKLYGERCHALAKAVAGTRRSSERWHRRRHKPVHRGIRAVEEPDDNSLMVYSKWDRQVGAGHVYWAESTGCVDEAVCCTGRPKTDN
jgi:hypothetical protein